MNKDSKPTGDRCKQCIWQAYQPQTYIWVSWPLSPRRQSSVHATDWPFEDISAITQFLCGRFAPPQGTDFTEDNNR